MAGTGLSDQQPARAASLLRDRAGLQRVTNIELFFDLVYVFAVTQLSQIGRSVFMAVAVGPSPAAPSAPLPAPTLGP